MCRACEGWNHYDPYMCLTCGSHANTREGVEHGTEIPCARPQVERHPDMDDNGNFTVPVREDRSLLELGLAVAVFAFMYLVRYIYNTYVPPIILPFFLWLHFALKETSYPYGHILMLLIGIASLWFYASMLRRLVKSMFEEE
jgi:hypothetical protein